MIIDRTVTQVMYYIPILQSMISPPSFYVRDPGSYLLFDLILTTSVNFDPPTGRTTIFTYTIFCMIAYLEQH